MESAVGGVQPLPDHWASKPMGFIAEAARLAAASYADVGLNHAKVGLGSKWRALTGRELDPTSNFLWRESMPGTTYEQDGGAAQVYISADGTRLAVSFRGTDGARDYLSYPTLLSNNYVERFHDLFLAVQAYLRASNIRSENVVLTGHSLGGAAAEAAQVYIPWGNVITFASPQTGRVGTQIGFDNDSVFRMLPLGSDNPGDLLLVHATNSRFGGPENISVAHSVFNYIDAMDLLAASSIDPGTWMGGIWYPGGPIAIMAPSLANLNALQLNAPEWSQLIIAGNGLGNFVVGRAQGDDVDGGGGNDTLAAGAGNDRLWGNADHDDLRGQDGDDTLWGGDGNDSLFGSAGRDQLTGGSGHDLLRGQAGDDKLWGEGGNDTLYGETNDLLDYWTGWETLVGGDGNDLIVAGDGNDAAWGDADNDTIFGEAGNDTLRGGAGTDRLIGGLGNDNYWLNDVADVVVEALNHGRDTVYTTGARAVLAANVEELHAALDDQGNGGSLARHLTGNVIDNWIAGLAGADTLVGGGGNDTFRGGAGVDWLIGGAGDDVYLDERFYGGTGVDRIFEARGQGIDLIRTEATTFTLPANVERLESLYTHGATETRTLTGNTLDNVIRAGGQNSILRGLDGADSLMGHNGHDTLIGGAGRDTLDGSVIGNDHFRFTSTSDSTVNSPDLIRFFWHQPGGSSVDRIALNLMDADVARAGDQAFTFIGGSAFSGIAGQLRVEMLAASMFRVSGDVNGDSRADFAIDVGTVPSTTPASAAWFIL